MVVPMADMFNYRALKEK